MVLLLTPASYLSFLCSTHITTHTHTHTSFCLELSHHHTTAPFSFVFLSLLFCHTHTCTHTFCTHGHTHYLYTTFSGFSPHHTPARTVASSHTTQFTSLVVYLPFWGCLSLLFFFLILILSSFFLQLDNFTAFYTHIVFLGFWDFSHSLFCALGFTPHTPLMHACLSFCLALFALHCTALHTFIYLFAVGFCSPSLHTYTLSLLHSTHLFLFHRFTHTSPCYSFHPYFHSPHTLCMHIASILSSALLFFLSYMPAVCCWFSSPTSLFLHGQRFFILSRLLKYISHRLFHFLYGFLPVLITRI